MQSKKNHQDNIKTIEIAAQKAKDTDLLVLPEYSGLLDKNVAEAAKINYNKNGRSIYKSML